MIDEALTRLAREDGGRVLAILARRYADLDLADDAVQEALAAAVVAWPRSGIPDNPAGWLMTVAGRHAIDAVRRRESARRRTTAAARDLLEDSAPAEPRGLVVDGLVEGAEMDDERLRLMLLCCHPALNLDAQVALTLRLVGGLTTGEIAAAYLVPEPTITQRIVRAKRKIRDAGIPLSIPAALDERVAALLAVLYLVFNEGYLSAGSASLVRTDLADEAIRLARVVHGLLPTSREASGLLALLLYQRSRFATRLDAHGDLVRLEDQDRTRWDGSLIAAANAVLAPTFPVVEQRALRASSPVVEQRALRASSPVVEQRALRASSRPGEPTALPGPYQLQAAIASVHANARTAADTDWSTIATAYAQLALVTGSPVVRLNQAVAVGMADGPHAGLALLGTISGLEDYHLLHATRADLLERAGDPAGAAVSYRRARDLATNPAERRHLDRRLNAVSETP